MVDVNQALDGTGPFAPERSGGLPVGDVVRMCFGVAPYEDLRSDLRADVHQAGRPGRAGRAPGHQQRRRGRASHRGRRRARPAGLRGHGLSDCQRDRGHGHRVCRGRWMPSSSPVVWPIRRCWWTGSGSGWPGSRPLLVYPGEDEMLALAQGALRVLRGRGSRPGTIDEELRGLLAVCTWQARR